MSSLISICVDNFGRSYMLPFLLKCYERQSRGAYKEGRYEIEMVIVDDDSQDHFTEFLRLGLDVVNPPFRVRAFQTNKCVTYNPALPLNIAVKKSKGDLLVLNHSDLFPHPKSCLNEIRRWHQKHPNSALSPGFIYEFDRLINPPMWFGSPLPNGLSLPKSIFEEIGGYDERFYGGPSVDSDLTSRLRQHLKHDWYWDKVNEKIMFLHIGAIAHVPPRMRTAPWRSGLDYVEEIIDEGVRSYIEKAITEEEFCLERLYEYNNSLHRMNLGHPIVNPDGWGELDTLEEIKL